MPAEPSERVNEFASNPSTSTYAAPIGRVLRTRNVARSVAADCPWLDATDGVTPDNPRNSNPVHVGLTNQRQRFIGRTQRWMERLHAAGHIGEGNFPVLADVLGSTVEQTCYVHIGLPEQAPRQEQIQELARCVAEVWFRSLPPPAPAG